MITGAIPIRSDQWTEVGGGATWLQMGTESANGVYLHFTEQAGAPDLDASSHYFGSWPQDFDFDKSGYPEGQRVWARSKAPTDVLVITRNANFYFTFIPLGFDSLITSDGDDFKVLGNG